MLDKILSFAEKYNMLPHGSTVLCGLSGGADSVCLTVCLNMLSEMLGISVEAIHINHCIRGQESDRDEVFCRELCERLSIPFTAVSCNVPDFAEKNSLSLEEAARKLRYECFQERSHGKIVATAHNADDNLETAILNLARGTGISGISGIPPVRDNIVRPLLTVTRAEIEDFLSKNGFSFVTDSTNLSDDYTRNKIRHRIVPLLHDINPAVTSSFIHSSDTLHDENNFIELETEKALKLVKSGNTLTGLKALPSLLRRRCIRDLLSENNLSYNHDLLLRAEALAQNGGKLNISNDIFLVSEGNVLELKKITHAEHELLSAELIIGDNCLFKGKILRAELVTIPQEDGEAVLLDCDKLEGKLILRNRRFGDKIKLAGRGFTSSVKKLINEKIPQELRHELHFIEDEKGTVFAESLGIAQRIAPTEETERFLRITIVNA